MYFPDRKKLRLSCLTNKNSHWNSLCARRTLFIGLVAVPARTVSGLFREEDLVVEYYVVTDLGTLPGGASSNAYDINDRGQVVGSSQVAAGQNHAVLWTPMTPLKDLGTLPGGSDSQAS